MPTRYSNNPIVIELTEEGQIQQVLVNHNEDLIIQPGESAIHLFDSHSHSTFFDALSATRQNNISFGYRMTMNNMNNAFLFMLRQNDAIVMLCFSFETDVMELFDELIQINNEQIDAIRVLTKKLAHAEDVTEYLDEIMSVNNELINTRRELSIKNRQLQRLNQDLETMNNTDYLTQLPNRRKFFHDAYEVVKKKQYRLTMMDFNNFKVVNDQYGHQTGDELLITFAREMTTLCDSFEGTLYRLGGDEFAILSPASIAYDLDSIIATIDGIIQSYDPNISIAYGTVVIDHTSVNEEHKVEESMAIADKMMYVVKKNFHDSHDTMIWKDPYKYSK